eukprot:GFUD01034581.1.p1 GENE.GFUD01034581.1~~GFUD01034581.1.p1  ORF type:complete len:461 (+),score=140.68 GFUD01034581.1:63-1445(+)
MSEASLSSLPGNSLPGLNMRQVENERMEMWEKMFQKYEEMEQNEETDEEVDLEDLDNPVKVHNIFKDGIDSSAQGSRSVIRYIRDHADELDEIATVAGPPLSDEEVLSDDSDNELLHEDIEASDDPIDSEGGENVFENNNNMPLTPLSSTFSEVDTDDNNGNITISNRNSESVYGDYETSEGDDNKTLANVEDSESDCDYESSESDDDKILANLDDSDDDDILYTSDTLSQSRSVSDQSSPKFHSDEPSSKKIRQVFPCSGHTDDPHSHTSSQLSSQEVLHREDNDGQEVLHREDNDGQEVLHREDNDGQEVLPKFGGSGKRRQACVKRRCSNRTFKQKTSDVVGENLGPVPDGNELNEDLLELGSNMDENTVSTETDLSAPIPTSDNLVCSECDSSTFYQALLVTESELTEFVCDDCMVGDHMECLVEECEVCKEVGEAIVFRRNVEVLARVSKYKHEL